MWLAGSRTGSFSEVSTFIRSDTLPDNFNLASSLQSFPRFHSAHHNNKLYSFKKFRNTYCSDCVCENPFAGNLSGRKSTTAAISIGRW
jgi:hypothetical protein